MKRFVSSLNGLSEVTQIENQVILVLQHMGRKAGRVIRTSSQEGDSLLIFSICFQLESPSEIALKGLVFCAFWKGDLA